MTVGAASPGSAIKNPEETQVKHFLKIAARVLMNAANGRAMHFMRKQAELVKPSNIDYRSNAGGWN